MRWTLFRRKPAVSDDQRAQPRVGGHARLACSLGEVMDVSLGGLRVACRGRVPDHAGKLERFTLGDAQQQVAFTARVVRVNPTGFRRYELGLAFVGLSVQEQGVLRVLAKITPPPRKPDAPRSRPAGGGAADYYRVLGLAPGASEDQIREAYRRLARKYHPDVSRGETAKLFQRVHEAYAVLKDTAARREYDAMYH